MSHGREKDAEMERRVGDLMVILTELEARQIMAALERATQMPDIEGVLASAALDALRRGINRGTVKLCEELKERTKT